MQFSTHENSPPLAAKQCTEIQKITGSVLYYSRAVDPTVLVALNDIATEQTAVTEKTKTAAGQLLDYLATHPDAKIRFQASDMILRIHSDASYLSFSKSRSSLWGIFYLGYNPPNQDKLNGSILNVASVMKNVVASAGSWRMLPKCTNCSPPSHHPSGTSPQATSNSSQNGQFHSLCHTQ
jgi:hypothetical protein